MNVPAARVALLVGLLGGCAAVGPDYDRPVLTAPAKWGEAESKAEAATALEKVAWWKTFDDPLLDELIEQAAKNNLDLARARARIVQTRAGVVVAGAAGLPSLNVSGSATRTQGSRNAALPSQLAPTGSPRNIYLAGFDARWEIDVFGGVRRSVEAATARLEASVEDLRGTLVTLLGEVARNYVELRANQDQIRIAQRNVQAQQQTVEVTRERYRLGLTSYLDVVQAEAQKTATESNVPTLEAAVKQSVHRLGVLLGSEPKALQTELSAPRPLPRPDRVTAIGLPSELLLRRPDLRWAERQLAAASADIGVATAALYPRFDLTLGLGLQSNSAARFAEASSRYWSIIPGVSLPLFDAGSTRATITASEAAYDEALADYRSALNNALQDVENALVSYYAEQVRRGILIDTVRANEEAVALANERYRRGLTSFLDVLTAENSLYGAQRGLSQSEANLLTSLVSLYKALGGGWSAADIEAAGDPAQR